MSPKDVDLGDEAVMPNPIAVIVPTTDPLAKRSVVSLQKLAQRRFIFREKVRVRAWRVTSFFGR